MVLLVLCLGLSPLLAVENLVRSDKPYVLRRLAGSITLAGDPWGPGFSARFIHRFHVVGQEGPHKEWDVRVDDKGRFDQPLPPGTYNFYLDIEGWDDAEGIIIIDPQADKDARFSIELGLS